MVAHWNSAATVKAQEPFVLSYHKALDSKGRTTAIANATAAVRVVLDTEGRHVEDLEAVCS